MRSSEGSIRQSEYGDDHEEDEDTDETGEHIVVPLRVISGEGSVGESQDTDEQQADGVGLVEELYNDNHVSTEDFIIILPKLMSSTGLSLTDL